VVRATVAGLAGERKGGLRARHGAGRRAPYRRCTAVHAASTAATPVQPAPSWRIWPGATRLRR